MSRLLSSGDVVPYYNRPIEYSFSGSACRTITIDGTEYTVPDGYTLLDYIVTDGSASYINPNVTINSSNIGTTKIELVNAGNSSTAGGSISGASKSGNLTLWGGLTAQGSGTTRTIYYSTGASETSAGVSVTLANFYKFVIDAPNNTYGVYDEDDTVIYEKTDINYSCSGSDTFTLGGFSASGSVTCTNYAQKIKSFKMWQGGTQIRNMVPAKNSSDEIGMYDFVTNTFFTNAGTGTFTAGSELPSVSTNLGVKGVGDKVSNAYIVTVDTACANAGAIKTWLTSKGIWDKKIHLNKAINQDIDAQFVSKDSWWMEGGWRYRNTGGWSSFEWTSDYTCILNVGDELLVYDDISDLIGLNIVSDLASTTSHTIWRTVANTLDAKTYFDSHFFGTGVLTNSSSSRTTTYDALSVTITDNISTAGTRVGGDPLWGQSNYTYNTYVDDVWTVTSGSLTTYEVLNDDWFNRNGLGLTEIKPYKYKLLHAHDCGMIVYDGSDDEPWALSGWTHTTYNPFYINNFPSTCIIAQCYVKDYPSVDYTTTEPSVPSWTKNTSNTFLVWAESEYDTLEKWKAHLAQKPLVVYYKRNDDTSWTAPTAYIIYDDSQLFKIDTYADTISSTGTRTNKVIAIDIGAQTYGMLGSYTIYDQTVAFSPLVKSDSGTTIAPMLCESFKPALWSEVTGSSPVQLTIAVKPDGNGFTACTSEFDSLSTEEERIAAFKAKYSGTYAYCVLRTEATETITCPTITNAKGTNYLEANTAVPVSELSATYRRKYKA